MIRSLRIFCDLVETGSFSKAARRNYLTQPAVSQHLKGLEETFGRRLIERGKGHLRLTPSGEQLFREAKEILERYRRLEEALREPTEVSGTLRVATIYTIGLHELPPYLSRFLREHPDVDLQLNYLKFFEIYEAVLAGQMDLGLVAYPKERPGIQIQPFRNDRYVLVVSPGHPLAKQGRVSLKRLEGERFVALSPNLPTRKGIDAILRKDAIRVRVVHEFDNIEIVKRAVEIGSGVALVPYQTVVGEAKSGTLKTLELAEGPFYRPLGIVTRKGRELSLASRHFIRMLLAPTAAQK